MKKLILYGLILSMALAGCGKAAKDTVGDNKIPVKVMKVMMEDLEKTLEYVGNIEGVDETMVYPKVPGKIIEKVKEEGSDVVKGEAIAFIDRDEVGLKFEKSPVESPINGTVGRVYVDIGSSVTPQTAVAFVADMSRAEVNLDIPEKYLPQVTVGQEAQIRVDSRPDEVFLGKVTQVSPRVDTITRSAPIEITIDNTDGKLQSGMFAKVKLIIGKSSLLPVVLKESVIGRDPDTYVYVVENGKARFVKVQLGVRQGPYYGIEQGLKEGDEVVVMGQQKLRDGAAVAEER